MGVVGRGGVTTSYLSVKPIQIKTQEGQTASVRPYVATTALTLWGRDCLGQRGVGITTDFLTGATVLQAVKQPPLGLLG